ncbi:hypothetical protein Tco_0484288 [Tanacetum coccineum]
MNTMFIELGSDEQHKVENSCEVLAKHGDYMSKTKANDMHALNLLNVLLIGTSKEFETITCIQISSNGGSGGGEGKEEGCLD